MSIEEHKALKASCMNFVKFFAPDIIPVDFIVNCHNEISMLRAEITDLKQKLDSASVGGLSYADAVGRSQISQPSQQTTSKSFNNLDLTIVPLITTAKLVSNGKRFVEAQTKEDLDHLRNKISLLKCDLFGKTASIRLTNESKTRPKHVIIRNVSALYDTDTIHEEAHIEYNSTSSVINLTKPGSTAGRRPIKLRLEDGNQLEQVPDQALVIPGYSFLRRDRRTHGGGVALYYRSSTHLHRLTSLETQKCEVIWFQASTREHDILGCAANWPPASDLDIRQHLQHTLDEVSIQFNTIVLLAGDLNAHHPDLSESINTNRAGRLPQRFATVNALSQVIEPQPALPPTVRLVKTSCLQTYLRKPVSLYSSNPRNPSKPSNSPPNHIRNCEENGRVKQREAMAQVYCKQLYRGSAVKEAIPKMTVEIWGMRFNASKTVAIFISHITTTPPPITFVGSTLEYSKEHLNMGFFLDSALSPQAHVNALIRKGATEVFLLLKLYKMYVRPHLEHASPAWAALGAKQTGILESLQGRAMRVILTLPRTHQITDADYAVLNITSLGHRRNFALACFMFKLFSNHLPRKLSKYKPVPHINP
ncbi:hypothetical protein CAPTEDRAFT_191199 [Capitella teleta]|uniref:Endonuclease/exonuclease/phosphatase domain-containing protein n=1 Tax=Capitella teleta TaxID=283909 RepID=R7UGM4_CAPTE|nr:hypothetical protein CAPTEDRAFT_191199 [Capitella teleta]|eukprot:ELU02918.1 hypothetical protein CAPTEDRAFT_191199 [Capitella teleta]